MTNYCYDYEGAIMKKVGIVSCYFHHNYGSMLQAFATQRVINELGFECENINIAGIKEDMDRSKMKFYLKRIYDIQVLKGTIIRIVKKVLYRKVLRKTFGEKLDQRKKAFEQFIDKHFIISEYFGSREKLSNKCESIYSDIVLGSDQLWLPSNIEADYYTLSWVPDQINKVSYATSFGTSFLPKKQVSTAKKFLSRINHLSVRESSGIDMITEYTSIKAKLVCDPTLLFTSNQWREIHDDLPIINEEYILCYFLGNNIEDRKFAERLKNSTGYKIVAILHLDEYIKYDDTYSDIAPFNIGPSELLNLISNAKYVVTDSFHGTCFSILYKKEFFTSRRVRKKGLLDTNSRIDSLFSILDIEGRLILGNENIADCINNKLNYVSIHNKLEAFRKESLNFLKDALED